MKRRNNRFLAGTLAGLMMLTMLPVTALAAADGTAENGAPVSGASDNGIENVVNDTGVSQDTGANADANDTRTRPPVMTAAAKPAANRAVQTVPKKTARLPRLRNPIPRKSTV